MSNKKFKLKLDTENFEMQDFEGHALKKNMLAFVSGGNGSYAKQIHSKSGYIKNFSKLIESTIRHQ